MNTKLKAALGEKDILELERVCNEFKEYTSEQVWQYLWNLTYMPKFALEKMGLVGIIFLSYAKKVRNEILIESGNKSLIEYEVAEEEELYHCLECDKFTLKVVKEAIEKFLFDVRLEEMERVAFLLSSEHINHQYGGLRAIGFNPKESEYLVKYIKPIAKYFSKLFSEVKENITKSQKEKEVILNENLEKRPQEEISLDTAVETTCEEVVIEENNAVMEVTQVVEILKNLEPVEKFLNSSILLETSNFDLGYLLDNRKEILMLLAACKKN